MIINDKIAYRYRRVEPILKLCLDKIKEEQLNFNEFEDFIRFLTANVREQMKIAPVGGRSDF